MSTFDLAYHPCVSELDIFCGLLHCQLVRQAGDDARLEPRIANTLLYLNNASISSSMCIIATFDVGEQVNKYAKGTFST